MTVLSLIGNLITYKVTQFAVDSEGMEDWEDDRHVATVEAGANVVSSKRPPRYTLLDGEDISPHHAVLLDIDVPAYLIPSSTPGHSHLYIDKYVREEHYFELLDVLAKCGVIERGYANASKKKGATFLRLPWVKKGAAA